jgi:hypothetical protein
VVNHDSSSRSSSSRSLHQRSCAIRHTQCVRYAVQLQLAGLLAPAAGTWLPCLVRGWRGGVMTPP